MNILNFEFRSTPYTYILEWTKFNKRYIGARWAKNCHPEDLWSTYFTSSKWVREFVAENGPPDLILIDQVFKTGIEAVEREQFLLKKYDIFNNPVFLNKAISGAFDSSDPDILRKKSEANKGKKRSREICEKISRNHGLRGKPGARLGVKITEETRRRLSLSHMGYKQSEETKRKRADKLRGRKQELVKCPFCDVVGGKATMPRWHFNRCKKKER